MKTDYKNLNLFEVLLVVMIAGGLMLTGLVLFSGLNQRQQHHVISALQMFDVHEQVSSDFITVEKLVALQDKFYSQFYSAFAQVASVDLNSQVASMMLQFSKASTGQVAGASIDLQDRGKYDYVPPNLEALFQKINLNIQY